MLFEDLYDSVLRRYRASPPKAEQERPSARGRLYELLDATREVREVKTNAIPKKKANEKSPSK